MSCAVLVAVLAASGCERDLVADLPDAREPLTLSCPTADPSSPQKVVFLSTEGVSLVKSLSEDATRDLSSVITADATIPPFLDGNPDRDAFIRELHADACQIMAPYAIDIVTTRPLSGTYQMISLGGSGEIANCSGCSAQTPFSCDGVARGVSLMFDYGTASPPLLYANAVASEIGTLAGLVSVREVDDCMCRLDDICPSTPGVSCHFGTAAPVSPQLPEGFRCGMTVVDEPGLLCDRIGCR